MMMRLVVPSFTVSSSRLCKTKKTTKMTTTMMTTTVVRQWPKQFTTTTKILSSNSTYFSSSSSSISKQQQQQQQRRLLRSLTTTTTTATTTNFHHAFSTFPLGFSTSVGKRRMSSHNGNNNNNEEDSIALGGPVALNVEDFQRKIESLAPSIAQSLLQDGYFTIDNPNLLFGNDNDNTNANNTNAMFVLQTLRSQAEALREEGRYEQSWSESIDETTGTVTRFDKPGVFACEPDGADYETAPDLISYMATIITILPPALNQYLTNNNNKNNNDNPMIAKISNQAFNAKLAVTCKDSEYPLHVDNSLGVQGNDTRKLTCILYLNPEYDQSRDQGELRIHLLNNHHVDLDPCPGRWILFWTDEIPHKVLPTGNTAIDRYALTIWLADDDPISHIHNPNSKFAELRYLAFDKNKNK